MIQVILVMAVSISQSAVQFVPFRLGGDRRPDTIRQSFEAACGEDRVLVEIQTVANRSNRLTKVLINNEDMLGSPDVEKANAFLKTVRFPSLTAVTCPNGAVSFAIQGAALTGTTQVYRVTLPLHQR
jgi:hypothetical protein